MIEPPRVPIELRLLALEAKVSGVEPYSLTDASSGEGSHARARPRDQPESSRSGLRRISEIQTALDKLGQESEGIKRFLSNFPDEALPDDSYLPLLHLPGDATATAQSPSTSETTRPDDSPSSRSLEFDLLPPKVKSTMVLEAATDIKALERDLREVEVWKTKGVEGSGQLQELLSRKPALQILEKETNERQKEYEKARGEVEDVLLRYDRYNHTVSDMFLELHHRLEAMEDMVARAERQRKKELAEQY